MTLPEKTKDGKPARAWCHVCTPVQGFESIEKLQQHVKDGHRVWKG